MKKKPLAVLCTALAGCAVLTLLWLQSRQEAPAAAERSDTQKIIPIDCTLKEVHGNDLAFSATLDDLICSYNGVYSQRNGKEFFPAARCWNSISLSRGIHSAYPARRFYFCQDETVHSLPTVTVYTPLEERSLQEITINFDEHSFTDVGYQQYKELCLCAVLTFFPEFSPDSAQELCDRILQLGNQNSYGSDDWFGYDAVPCGIFYGNGIGLYPYEAIGDWRRFCIFPVTPERLEDFREKGAVVYEVADIPSVSSDDPSRLSGSR